ncbi:S41 family peptidase [Fodinibius saliphilus]|uniref:S41 family peptidase n=1 Tax=Fodinibius saliphilus TaxID=1920650 RepID=UPI001109B4E8|nr:S41 family peptidase [Fodinibius saliphilus]
MYFSFKVHTLLNWVFLLSICIGINSHQFLAEPVSPLDKIKITGFENYYIAKTDTLPFPPEQFYRRATPRSERLMLRQEIPKSMSVQEWRADLDTLASLIRQRIPYYEAAINEKELTRRVDSLKQLVPEQTRDQRIFSLMQLANLPALGTGHTRIRSAQSAIGWRAVPLFPYRFADGVYIMAAINTDWIDSEILSVNGIPVDEVYEALSKYVSSDNRWDMWRDVEEYVIQFRWANHLKALDFIDDINNVPLEIRTPEGERKEIQVKTLMPNTAEYVAFATMPPSRPLVPENLQWSPGSEPQSNREPNYSLSYRDSTQNLYLDLNLIVHESEDWTLNHLADSLGHIADSNPINKMIIDLRTNGGGNSSDAEPLIRQFADHPKFNQRGKLYTLISPETTSAGGIFAMQMERRTKTIFAGENSSFNPNIWGETVPAQLPNSKIVVLLSHTMHQEGMPDTPRTYLEPDIRVPMTSDQHFNNQDLTMTAVKEHQPPPRYTIELDAEEREKFTGTYRISPVHRATITNASGQLHLQVDDGAKQAFIDTELYPLSTHQLATDITDVYIDRRLGNTHLDLIWKDTTYAMHPEEGDFKLPAELIRAGKLDEAEKRLKSAISSGMKLGGDFIEHPLIGLVEENPLPVWPDDLTKEEKAQRALPYAKLADKLAPMSWYSTAELAQLYKILGQEGKMMDAAHRIVKLSPVRGANFVREYIGLEVAPNGEIIAE